MEFTSGRPEAVSAERDCDAFEHESGVLLPDSYRAWVTLFGPGELSKCFEIAAPGFAERAGRYDLATFSWESQEDVAEDDLRAYVPDPLQFRRMVFFCEDIQSNHYGWDPAEVTYEARHECAVYVVFRDWKVIRLASSFQEFIRDIVLGDRHRELYEETPRKLWSVPFKLRRSN